MAQIASQIDVCRFNPTTGGTTDWTFSTAVTGYQSPTLAGVTGGATYHYRAESADLTQWEVGEGTFTTGTGVLARTTVFFNSSGTGTGTGQSGAGTKINFATTPQVAFVFLAEDINPYTQGTWTPTLVGSSTSGTGQTYTTQVGTWERNGRTVTARFSLVVTGLGTAAGNAQIGGLPFTSVNTANVFGHGIIASYSLASNTAGNTGVNGSIAPNAAVMDLQSSGLTASGTVTIAQAGAAAIFRGTAIYQGA